MRTFTRGGVHPPEEKITSKKEFEIIKAPEKVFIPVSQHLGAPAKPVVKVGEFIKKGQLLAELGGKISTNIHSSVSGKLINIEDRKTYTGVKCSHFVIENNGEDNWEDGLNVERNTDVLTRDEIIQAISDAGIVGMGGAAFPTHIKVVPPNSVDTLVINGAECEPYLTCDHRLMLEKTDDIISGVSLLMRSTGATRAIIGVESNKTDAAQALESAVKKQRLAGIRVVLLKVKYPQGAEKQLIEALVGRKVPPRELPFSVNVICQNIGTCAAIWEACRYKRPLIERSLTMSGDGIEKPGNIIVPIGTEFSYLFAARGLKETTKKIIAGGPMMGIAICDLNHVVMKGTSGLLAFVNPKSRNNYPCIRCGKCVEVCPMNLMPSQIGHIVEGELVDEYDKLGIPDCVECGACSFICPAGRPLVQLAKKGKYELAARRQ